MVTQVSRLPADPLPEADAPFVGVHNVSRAFKGKSALVDVSLTVARGSIHALLGPNGAGKTTLLRILTGLVLPDSGEIRLFGRTVDDLSRRTALTSLGLVPSGDRSFYNRLSGHENLVFFGRLAGLRRAAATRRSLVCLESVGLREAARKPVGLYSHGMQKRLSVARGLLMQPPILLVDEATHDLDPEGARGVQELVRRAADHGAAVVWTTQRLDEIRGFADRVTVLDGGSVQFSGTVPQLMSVVPEQQYILQIGPLTDEDPPGRLKRMQAAVGPRGDVQLLHPADLEHYTLSLQPGVALGDVITAMSAAGISVQACREERSGVEAAFLHLTRSRAT